MRAPFLLVSPARSCSRFLAAGMNVTHLVLSRFCTTPLAKTSMAHIRNNFIDIPRVTETLPANPLLGFKAPTSVPSVAPPTSGSNQKTLARKALLYDQRCLVTGAVSNQLQACHLINIIRAGSSNRKEKLPLRKQVVCR